MFSSNSPDRLFPSTEHCSTFNNISKILLIGEIGSGKSTFINYLYNYFHKGDLNNLKSIFPSKYHPSPTHHHESNIHDNTHQYMFTDSITNKQYLFVDTPGLSDTHSIEQNEINNNKILDAITQLGNLTSIIIVVNGSINRLTTHIQSIITCLNGNIPDIILENIIVILTHVKKHESAFDLNLLNLHGKVYPFYMQNCAFVSDPQTWKNTIRDEIQSNWNHSMNQIKFILQTIDSFKQTSLNEFLQIKQIRNEIKSIFHQTYLEIIQIQNIQDELSIAFKQTDQDRTQFKMIERIQLIDAPYYNTLCSTCHQVCHSNCHLNETVITGSQIFSQCLILNNNQCQQCQNHCSYKTHYYAKKMIQITYETLDDLKIQYDQPKQIIDKIVRQKLFEIKTKSTQLSQICSGFNLANEFDNLIKSLKIQLDLLKNLETKLQAENLIIKLTKYIHTTIDRNHDQSRRQRPSMQIILQEESIEKNSIAINPLKTTDLIDLYHHTTDHSLITSILNELHQRAKGKSTGPLSTPDEIIIINKSLEKYNHKNIQELSYSYHKLQQQIYNITKSDILKIVDINPELLIENFIVQTLLDDKEKTQQETPVESSSSSVIKSFPVPDMQSTSRQNSVSIGLSHLITPPYPSLNDPSPMPPLPFDYPFEIQQHNDQPGTAFCLDDYRYDSKSTISADVELDVMPINNEPQTTYLFNSTADFTLEYQRESPSDEQTSIPDDIPSNNNLFASSNTLPNHLENKEDFRLLNTSLLLSMYNDANFQKNESRKDAIHEELERRCYGDYPILIKEKNYLLRERISTNQMKTIGELLIAQAAIKQKIRGYLINNNVTLINNIPSELIIEAYTLDYLISLKRQA
jgi:hypothetical protein